MRLSPRKMGFQMEMKWVKLNCRTPYSMCIHVSGCTWIKREMDSHSQEIYIALMLTLMLTGSPGFKQDQAEDCKLGAKMDMASPTFLSPTLGLHKAKGLLQRTSMPQE